MDAAMIGQIEKARQYSQDPERVSIEGFATQFEGKHTTHNVTYEDQTWHCDCKVFHARGVCSHVMTMERVLTGWVDPAEVPSNSYDATMIAQIDKSRQYAEEPDRIHFVSVKAVLKGNHHNHVVTYDKGEWHCDCHVFETRGLCSHVMAMERILKGWVDYAEGLPVHA
jgi:hypothetical protein